VPTAKLLGLPRIYDRHVFELRKPLRLRAPGCARSTGEENTIQDQGEKWSRNGRIIPAGNRCIKRTERLVVR
jgi:hypothetical protein